MSAKTDKIRETLENQGRNKLRAYYYSFEPTGVPAVDSILGAVAMAGSWAHSTEDWDDDHYRRSYGFTPIEAIQAEAQEAADSIERLTTELDEARADNERLREALEMARGTLLSLDQRFDLGVCDSHDACPACDVLPAIEQALEGACD